ncbi:hypothetical protein Forpe1208_v005010 [Fusarium oxysporum f. sp. rapae]|uniref:Uncharacterized protein n=1 Tax=Fusarium oxysporum f. sp. rapae TaxID=485398 RepID=A0A8J5U008_FUSOX|nr:hypothetical protein Forpe1208_v005010 [Fusarium oxysporum f. sp. rapae]
MGHFDRKLLFVYQALVVTCNIARNVASQFWTEEWDSNMIADSGPLLEVAITCYADSSRCARVADFEMTLYQEQSSTARRKTDSASPRLRDVFAVR